MNSELKRDDEKKDDGEAQAERKGINFSRVSMNIPFFAGSFALCSLSGGRGLIAWLALLCVLAAAAGGPPSGGPGGRAGLSTTGVVVPPRQMRLRCAAPLSLLALALALLGMAAARSPVAFEKAEAAGGFDNHVARARSLSKASTTPDYPVGATKSK